MEITPTLLHNHLVILAVALGFNLMLAGEGVRARIPRMLNPLNAMIRFVAWVEKKLNRTKRSPNDRYARGTVMTLGLLVLAVAVGWGLMQGAKWAYAQHEYGWLVEALLVSLFLPVRQVNDALSEVVGDYTRVSFAELRSALGMAYPFDTGRLDDHALFRTGIELAVQTVSERVMGAALWYMLLGLPGLCGAVVLYAVKAQIGYDDERFRAFGATPRRLYALLQVVPAIATSFLLILAAIVAPGAAPVAAIQALFQFALQPLLLPYAVMAGATSVSLLGPKMMDGVEVRQDWVGSDTVHATATHLRIALGVFRGAVAISLAVLVYAVSKVAI